MSLKSFWAVELVPGKEFTTTPEFDVHVTLAVLPAAAADKGRTLITAKYDDEDEEGKVTPGQAFTIASLKLDHNDSQNIDLIFDADVPVTFSVSGKNPVHLVGSLVPPTGDDEFGYDSEDEDISDEDEEEEDEEAEAAITEQLKKRPAPQQTNGAPNKKPKQEQAAPKQEQAPKQKQQQQQQPKQGGEQKKQQQQQGQKSPQQQGQKGETRTLQGGLQVTTIATGAGKEAKRGNKVAVKYVGKLLNGKVFDKSTSKPFTFGLGRGEVIKGWDLGVEGMKEGEKRKLVIPAALAYGSSGAPPDIPPNATLAFDVELVNVRG